MGSTRTLVIGLGLAGTCVSRALMHRGIDFFVLAYQDPSSSSKAAAGLVNPLAGAKFLPVPELESMWAQMGQAYSEFENTLECKLWNQLMIVRGFSREEELQAFKKRLAEGAVSPFVQQVFEPHPAQIHPLGPWGGYTGKGAVVSVPDLISKWAVFLQQTNRLKEERVDYDAFRFVGKKVFYQDLGPFDHVIFTEGWLCQNNPFFDWLPFQPAKGEILTLLGEKAWEQNQAWFQGHWLFQKRPGIFRAGATFTRGEWLPGPTESGKAELLQKIRPWIDASFEVIAHDWGVRPGVTDHRPVVGRHPSVPSFSILNGLGSRGSLYAPWLAEQLLNHVFRGDNLHPEYSIERHLKHFNFENSNLTRFQIA